MLHTTACDQFRQWRARKAWSIPRLAGVPLSFLVHPIVGIFALFRARNHRINVLTKQFLSRGIRTAEMVMKGCDVVDSAVISDAESRGDKYMCGS